jgi:aminoglycoside phosphotransferase (APT) family kinase protein
VNRHKFDKDDMPLDIEHPDELIAYLRQSGRITPNETPRATILAGGVSNRTVLVERDDGSAWVVKQALEKLRVKVDWFSDPARIHREAAALRALPDLAPPGAITPLVFEDMHLHLLAMQAVPAPHENWKTMLMAGDVRHDHVEQFGRLLGSIHRKAAERAQVLAPAFDDRSFFQSLRLEPYYQYAAQQVPAAGDFISALIRDTLASRFTLVHGDYSPKNILVHQSRLILLDHEVIHWGDGAFDIGFALAHLLSKAHHLAARRQEFAHSAALFWTTYRHETKWPDTMESRAVRHTLGCLLARVRGRSTLEYLNETERRRQETIVTAMIAAPPPTMTKLIDSFVARTKG